MGATKPDPRTGRSKPITPHAGSWAQSQANPEAYERHVAKRDAKKEA